MPAKRKRSSTVSSESKTARPNASASASAAAASSSIPAPVKGSWSYKTAATAAAKETALASAAAACKKRTKPGQELSAFVEREEMLKWTRHYDLQKLLLVRDSDARNEFIHRAGNQLLSFLVHDPSSPFSPKPGKACVFPHALITSIIIPYWSDAYEFDNEWTRDKCMFDFKDYGNAFICRMRLTNPLLQYIPDYFRMACDWPLLAHHTKSTRDELQIQIRLESSNSLIQSGHVRYLGVSARPDGAINISVTQITYSNMEPPTVSLYVHADEMVSGVHLHTALILSPDVYHYEKDAKTAAEFKRDPKPASEWAEIRCQLERLCELLEAKTCRIRYRHKSLLVQSIREQLAVIHELFRSKAVRARNGTQTVDHD